MIGILGLSNVFGESCNSKNFVCNDEDSFNICVDDESTIDPITCPDNLKCFDVCDSPCVPDITDCPIECEKTKQFSCVNNETAVTCDESGKGKILKCEAGQICQLNCSSPCTKVADLATCSLDVFQCPGPGMYPHQSDCKKYFLCLTNGTANARKCQSENIFDKDSGKCSPTANCSFPSLQCNEKGRYCFSNKLYLCPEIDSVPDVTDLNNIIDCVSVLTNGICDANCDVPCKSPGYEDRCPVDIENCSIPGTFPIINDCSRYYMCIATGSTYMQLFLDCPSGSIFDYLSLKCSKEKDATCKIDSAVTEEPTTTTSTTVSPPVPKCLAAGRIPWPGINCQGYVECIKLANGSFSGNGQFCPGTSKFNPKTKLCTNVAFECTV